MNVYLHMWRCKHFLLLKTHAQKHTQRTATQSHFLCSMAKKSKGSVRYYMCCFLLKAVNTLWCNMAYDETSIECMVAEESLYCVDLGTWGQVSGRAVYVRVK